jgi:hypothetical protein
VDLVHNVVLVHATPGNGTYPEPVSLKSDQTLTIPTPDDQGVEVPVARLLP